MALAHQKSELSIGMSGEYLQWPWLIRRVNYLSAPRARVLLAVPDTHHFFRLHRLPDAMCH